MVDLLQELTDIDTLHESEEGAEVLIDALVSSKFTSDFDGIDEATLGGSILNFLSYYFQTRQRRIDYLVFFNESKIGLLTFRFFCVKILC